ncbi:MAG: family 1 glycosylhydrolase [Armatimonadetes bacterium]|nr:family 1 glycosylhydrolase [Armatimonadota bacterium]
MMRLKRGVLTLSALLLMCSFARAAVEQDFEAISAEQFTAVRGANSAGTTLEISGEQKRSGVKALKINYKFAGGGWLEWDWQQPVPVPLNGDTLTVRLWLRGSGTRDLNSIALRFLDKGGEVWQWRLPNAHAALSGAGWQEVRGTLNVNDLKESWGAPENVNKVVDRPLQFSGFAFEHNEDAPATGAIFLDDLTFGDGASAAGATPRTPAATGAVASYSEDFEAMATEGIAPVDGRNAAGTTYQVVGGTSHGGAKAMKINYQFQGAGWLEFNWATPQPLNANDDQLPLSVWVKGGGNRHFQNGAVRLLDAKGEVWQALLPKFAEALNGDGWREYKVTLDLSNLQESWGAPENVDKKFDRPFHLLGFAFGHTEENAVEGTIYLDDLRAGEGKAIAASVPASTVPCVAFQVEQPSIVASGTEVKITGAASGASGVLAWRARDLNGKELARGQQPLTAASTPFTIVFTPRENGIVYVRAEMQIAQNTNNEPLAFAETRIAVMPARNTPVPASPFLMAVASHPERHSDAIMEKEVELMRKAGFAACRFDMNWGSIQPNGPDEWRWAKFDRLIALFEKNNIIPLPVMGYSPKWASTGDVNSSDWKDHAFAPPRAEAYTNFLQEAVKRYGKTIKYWEIWNEPDLASFWRGTAEQYAQLFNASIKAIKEIDPQAKVMNGGFSETRRRPDFIPTYIQHSIKPDIFAFHTHMQFANLNAAADTVDQNLKAGRWSDIPVWNNEAGYSTFRGGGEREQAAVLIKKFAFTAARGYQGYFWYDLRDDGADNNEIEHNWGLIKNDFTPKASLVAANTLLDALGGKKFVRRLDLGKDLYALQFEDAQNTVLVAWNEGSAQSTLPRFFQTGVTSAQVRDMMGVTTPLPVGGGLLGVSFKPDPQFIVLPGSDLNFSPKGTLLDFAPQVVAAPGAQTTWKWKLINPLNARLRGSAEISVEGGWSLTPSTQSFDVAPGATAEYAVAVTAPGSVAATGSPSLKISISSPDLPQTFEAAAQLKVAPVITRWANAGTLGNATKWKTPLVDLNQPGNYVSLFEATPEVQLHFKGAGDLSAQLFLARVPEGVLVAVRARDDVHFQNEVAGEEWKGDSLQFGFASPDGKSVWEWTAALTKDGPRTHLGIAPEGVDISAVQMPVSIVRDGDITRYEVLVKGGTPALKALFDGAANFNAIINDNDGQGRKGWVEWTPGIGKTKDATLWTPVIFE